MGVLTLTVDELREVEAIRKLRALYGHKLDGHDWDGLAELFAEDAVCEFTGAVGYSDWVGREEIRAKYPEAALAKAAPFAYLHMATNGVIDIAGDDTATGRWFLCCLVVGPEANQPVSVAGVYDETYRKVDGAWYIARTRIDHTWRKPA